MEPECFLDSYLQESLLQVACYCYWMESHSYKHFPESVLEWWPHVETFIQVWRFCVGTRGGIVHDPQFRRFCSLSDDWFMGYVELYSRRFLVGNFHDALHLLLLDYLRVLLGQPVLFKLSLKVS